MHIIFCLNDSTVIAMRGMESVKFPKQAKRINPLIDFNILILFIPLCIFTLSIPITIEHKWQVMYFKTLLSVSALHHGSQTFNTKARTGNCRPVRGPPVDEQQQAVHLMA
jgi:hypothetical protein